jgi:hypothetical protein
MLFFAVFLLFLLFFLYFWRKLVIKHLSVHTRDTKALHGMKQVLKLMLADENLAKFDPSKDRGAFIPGESRRKKVRLKGSGREGALVALKKRLKK